jgi:tRNA A-37 threonylcarbamoyl transferase component Bud32
VGYTLVGLVARGGTAVVELATDGYGRPVARKRLLLTGTGPEIAVARQRLVREAEVLRGLRHPNIVPLWSIEEEGDDLVLVMPYLRGGSLATRMGNGRTLTCGEVARIGRDLLDALATAHRQGIVHRDIKPANILFDEWGRPALCDFGSAWTRQTAWPLTQVGTVLGTPAFMAPEQARGEPATPAADVFSLAATLAYALTGRPPYGEGPPDALLARAARGRVASLPPTIPLELRRPLAAMLQPQAARRPTAAEALGGPHGTAVLPRPPRLWRLAVPVGRPRTAPRRRPPWLAPLLAAGVAGCAVAAIAVVPGLLRRQPAAARQPAARHPAAAATATTAPTAHATKASPPPATAAAPTPRAAIPDRVDGTPLVDGQPIVANLVPAGEVDTYPMTIEDHLAIFPFCDGEIDVTLTAPPGATEQVRILDHGRLVTQAVSSNGAPATAAFPKPGCFPDHGGTYTVSVRGLAGATSADYRLERNGSW